MLTTCPYSVAVWNGLQTWLAITLQAPLSSRYRVFKSWWHNMLSSQQPNANEQAQEVVYTVWNIWKERCHRVFDSKGLSTTQL
jgi:hypothetical protein